MELEQILSRKLTSLFPDESQRLVVTEILNSYGVEKYEQEPYRVRLAILKLSGSDLDEIIKTTKYAKEDFRDILTWAEYPRQSKKYSITDGPKKERLKQADLEEYLTWLST